MSDEGEKTCPLCAEEMDLTDQQLKPCRCGYEICVWCWHHIMDMAEKDETEGRCPACRLPYDKEKIVGMAAKCERLVAEINMERKMKSQKSKIKTSEGRKQQLSSVRVIQRNLVYIVGLPVNLGDEDLLQRREYFGQYGKVLKVSMSRTAAGVIQQFPNNTCSVYITYSKEEEAVRCIQSVHGFVLEGKSLKACFGTTKYCHAWLRNMPCSNPDCLYLHEIGSPEDSFTKDEIISAYTRSRVQQISGTTNNMQRHSGSILPPPFDDYCITSSASPAKPIVKSASNNTSSITKDSSSNGGSGRSAAQPSAAAWGICASNQQLVASAVCSNGPSKQKPGSVGGSLAFSSAIANTTPAFTLQVDLVKKPELNEDCQISHSKGKSYLLESLGQHVGIDCQTSTVEIHPTPVGESATVSLNGQLASPLLSRCSDKGLSIPPNVSNASESIGHSVSGPEKEGNVAKDILIQNLCSDMSLMGIDSNVIDEQSAVNRYSITLPDPGMIKSPESLGLQIQADQSREPLMSPTSGKSAILTNDVFVSTEQFDWREGPQTGAVTDASPQEEEDVLSFDSQRLKDPEVVCRSTYLPNSVNSFHVSNHVRSQSLQYSEAFSAINLNSEPQFVDNEVSNVSHLHSSGISLISNGYPEKLFRSSTGFERTIEHPFLLSLEGKEKPLGRIQGDSDINTAVDRRENNIISNILSMDCDAWEGRPLALPKLFGEADKEPSSVVTSSWKGHNNNQSRFSFARQEETKNQAFDVERSFSDFIQLPKTSQNFSENRERLLDKLGIRNGFHPSSFEESDNFPSSPSVFSSNKLSVSRSQISAPPGFSVPSRAPPPGFSSHERVDQPFDALSGNHLLDSSSLLRNTYQTQHAGNISSTGDIEFMDPAILAVGKGRLQGGLNNPGLEMRSNFPPQVNFFENEARLRLMMQRSLSPHQNLRYADVGDGFNALSDSYAISSRLMDQSQVNNLSPFAQLSIQQSRNSLISNGHWDGWSEVQGGNSLRMAELLRNERLGFNKFYTGYEESKFRMPSSGDLYHRTFGM